MRWQTRPIINFKILGPIFGQLIQNKTFSRKWYSKNSGASQRPISGKLIQIWTSFPENGLAHAPEIEISKKYWMSFPEVRLYQTPKNVTFGKILDEFSDALGLYIWVPLEWSLLTQFITWRKLANQHQPTSSPLVEFNGYKRLKLSYDESNPI